MTLPQNKAGYGLLLTVSAAWLGAETGAWARDFRVSQIPNGTVFRCANCHVNPAGSGTRTPFGNDVFAITGTLNRPFWSPTLAAGDSDGDGFCNGQELGDKEGDGTPTPGATVTNPGVPTSKPANARPQFSSTAPTQAVIGLAFQYQAAATDVDTCQQLTYSKVAGPAWLTVSAAGLVAGTPPDGSASNHTVTVRVTDNGSPALNTNQTFTLSVVASFAGWQNLRFTLPAEVAQAALEADPDHDGIQNLVEYALRTNPKASNQLARIMPGFDALGRMTLAVGLRDDDPKLTALWETADTVGFSPSNSITGAITDPMPGDGFKTWTFTDTLSRSNANARFSRLKVRLLP